MSHKKPHVKHLGAVKLLHTDFRGDPLWKVVQRWPLTQRWPLWKVVLESIWPESGPAEFQSPMISKCALDIFGTHTHTHNYRHGARASQTRRSRQPLTVHQFMSEIRRGLNDQLVIRQHKANWVGLGVFIINPNPRPHPSCGCNSSGNYSSVSTQKGYKYYHWADLRGPHTHTHTSLPPEHPTKLLDDSKRDAPLRCFRLKSK